MPQRPVGVRQVFNFKQAIPRMSWAPQNLYNLWRRTYPDGEEFRMSQPGVARKSLFKERWMAKTLTKGYHADHLPSKKFARWYLPQALPVMRSNDSKNGKKQSDLSSRRLAQLQKDGLSPVGTMMFAETERRLDVLIFRACFASSVWNARAYVVQGHVKLNGELCRNPNTLLNPGDLFTVNPAIIPFINQVQPKGQQAGGAAKKAAAAEAEEVEEVEEAVEESAEAAEAAAEEGAPVESTGSPQPASSASSASPAARKYDTPRKQSKVSDHFRLPAYAEPHLFVPAYLLPSYLTCSAVYVRHPTARAAYSEIPSPYDAAGPLMSMTWEWYQKVAPRMRPRRRARLLGPERRNDRK